MDGDLEKRVADLAARGFSANRIAEKTGLTAKRVREILRNEDVIKEICRITSEIFSEGDRHLAILYQKALTKLDEHLDSPNLEIQGKAIEKVLKFFQPKDVEKRPLVAQFFGGEADRGMKSLNQVIIEERERRGLPPLEEEED
jgi:transcriptional regulator with XRE-family HTH domain